jgi:hypothetical protein
MPANMKRFALAFFVMAFLLSNLAAKAASATFATRRGEIFQLLLNGRLMNGPGSSQVRIDRLPAGPHNVEFRVPARRGFLTFCTRIFLERGFETNYVLVLPGYNPNFMLKKASVVPLRPPVPVCNTCPPPPGYGNSYGNRPNEVYDDYDSYKQAPNGNYQNNQNYNQPNYPGNGNGGNYNNGSYNNGVYNNTPGYGNNYNGNSGYGNVQAYMSRSDVDMLVENIRKKSFESSKLDIAKQALSNSNILTEDVKKILRAFDFESSRLEFAKFVYPKVYDQQNFYQVYDAFDFESSASEMRRWLKK